MLSINPSLRSRENMRKLIWCCSAIAVLSAGGLFAVTFYGCRHPGSLVGRCLAAAIDASVLVPPVNGIAPVILQASCCSGTTECVTRTAHLENCVPTEPQPLEQLCPEPVALPTENVAAAPAPIRIDEEDDRDLKRDLAFPIDPEAAPAVVDPEVPMNRTEPTAGTPSTIDLHKGLRVAGDTKPASEFDFNDSQICSENDLNYSAIMPYCADDERPSTPVMPYATDREVPVPQAQSSEESELLPMPQEDTASAEHSACCPWTGCKMTSRCSPACDHRQTETKCKTSLRHWTTHKAGAEEDNEAPAGDTSKQGKDKPHPQGIDTMEYRPSDGGLNEFGPGPY
jgi:hypothetical protein